MQNMKLFSGLLIVFALGLTGCEKEPLTEAGAERALSPAQQIMQQYTLLARTIYHDAWQGAQSLQQANQRLVDQPNQANLLAAREAWLAARVSYQQSEAFRFAHPVVDAWEGQVNAWPLDEGFIDYVDPQYIGSIGNPGAQANIIASTQLAKGTAAVDLTELTPSLLAELNEFAGSEANVATGYHAIEFLLWGQDLNGTQAGAGERPYSDYSLGEDCTSGTEPAPATHCQRRGEYLLAASQLLVDDLVTITAQWQPDQANYAAEFLALSEQEGLRRILFAMGSLALGELAGERMQVALIAQSPEDEHDCFSDNTHNAYFYNALGIQNIYLGRYQTSQGQVIEGPSLADHVQRLNPELHQAMLSRLQTTQALFQQMVDQAEQHDTAFDQMIGEGNEQGQTLIRDTIAALVAETRAIEQVALVMGVTQLQVDNAGHDF